MKYMNSNRSNIFHFFSKLINRRGWNKNYYYLINRTWKNKEFNLYKSETYYLLYFNANDLLKIWPSIFFFKMRNVLGRYCKYGRPWLLIFWRTNLLTSTVKSLKTFFRKSIAKTKQDFERKKILQCKSIFFFLLSNSKCKHWQ